MFYFLSIFCTIVFFAYVLSYSNYRCIVIILWRLKIISDCSFVSVAYICNILIQNNLLQMCVYIRKIVIAIFSGIDSLDLNRMYWFGFIPTLETKDKIHFSQHDVQYLLRMTNDWWALFLLEFNFWMDKVQNLPQTLIVMRFQVLR